MGDTDSKCVRGANLKMLDNFGVHVLLTLRFEEQQSLFCGI